MYILGYSGLSAVLNFRQHAFPELLGQECRIVQGLDAAAVLIHDGKVIAAAEEERFTGIKHTEKFPLNAIQFCLAQAQIQLADVDWICHSFDHTPYQSLFTQGQPGQIYYQTVLAPAVQHTYFTTIWPQFPIEKRFVAVKHHPAHAASAFYPSGYPEALILVADGMGEVDSISLFLGRGNQLQQLQHYDLFSSLGMLYSMVTYHLGFSINSGEGKVMGLAPYGNPQRFAGFFAECLSLEPEGEIMIKGFLHNVTVLDRETYRGFRRWLAAKTIPPRTPDEPLLQEHKDLAASLQQALNAAILHLLTYWQNKTGLKQLCYAGGVGLNCTTNGVILRSGLFDKIYIPPAVGDAGTALGAALYHYKQTLNQSGADKPQRLPFYGPAINVNAYLSTLTPQILQEKQIVYQQHSPEEILIQAAQMLAQGKIIAWVQGEMEFGPRALGHRSILADPRRPEMRDKINHIVKKREAFRPFAPSVKREKAHIYFEITEDESFPSMLFVMPVREQYRQQLPAITHVDGTARIQTVDKNDHPYYWRLLDKFEEKTGLPMLLNTSFNVRGQPIVCTAKDAIETFLNLDIDALFIGEYMFYKIEQDAPAAVVDLHEVKA